LSDIENDRRRFAFEEGAIFVETSDSSASKKETAFVVIQIPVTL